MQISNNFFHGNDFTSSQLIDFQRFENNFYCLVLCFVKNIDNWSIYPMYILQGQERNKHILV